MYNILTCQGWESSAGSYVASAPCMKARIGIVILFFLIAMVRRWGGEEMGLDFNFFGGILLGILSYIILIAVTGNFKIAFVIALILSLVGGYGGGMFFGGGE